MAIMKDAAGQVSQSERNRADYLRRKAAGYYSDKLATKTQAERDAEAVVKRAKRHANGATARATIAELTERRQAIFNITEQQQPATVRGILYQCEVNGVVSKSDYKIVQTDLKVMRQNKVKSPLAGTVPYSWIVDTSRSVDHPMTFQHARHALDWLADVYRPSLSDDADCVVQVWLEKDALRGVLSPVTNEYDVPLLVARGFSSLSFIHEAAQTLIGERRPVYVYHFGDHDYYGRKASAAIADTLRDLAGEGVDIHFESVAVTPEQITKWNLPTRPHGLEGKKAREWDDRPTVELDAIAPNKLRALLKSRLSKHLPDKRLKALKAAGEADRELIRSLV